MPAKLRTVIVYFIRCFSNFVPSSYLLQVSTGIIYFLSIALTVPASVYTIYTRKGNSLMTDFDARELKVI